ncbi:ABC transporter permease [Paenibacillus allorhizosphaerae]|uniref:Multidrug ABC transporter permease YbhS n=1 Tax=Paenibacillus allorhizosphaerae TaxID=2849866 RepID=A0ABM8VTV0_9BACL|nr:ABC transporter permease [Paenibacillus allorhizosphaerae]CAG7657841.1 putative multidrug ABC transporter permease YbhS [Paenibacillus allorhizosphaerae]
MKSHLDEWKFALSSKFIPAILIAPLIVAALFGYMFQNSQINEAPVAVVDEDNSSYSRSFIDKVNATQYLDVTSVFNEAIEPEALMANEKYMAVIYLPRGMEELRFQGKSVNIGLLIDNSMPSAIGNIRTGMQELIMVENTSQSVGKLKVMGMSDEAAMGIVTPLSLQQRLLFNPTSDFIGFMVIGFVNVVALGITAIATASIVPRLRVEGTLGEALRSPFALWSRVLPYAIISCISLLLAFGLLKQLGGLRFAGQPFAFVVPLLLYTLTIGLMGMVVGWTAADPSKVALRTYAIVYPSFMLSGVQVAPIIFPAPIQAISHMLPLTWLFKFIRGMGYRGGRLAYYVQEMGVFVAMIGILSLLVGLLTLRETRRAKLHANISKVAA